MNLDGVIVSYSMRGACFDSRRLLLNLVPSLSVTAGSPLLNGDGGQGERRSAACLIVSYTVTGSVLTQRPPLAWGGGWGGRGGQKKCIMV